MCPTLVNVATLVPMPKELLVQLKKCVKFALNVTSLMVSLGGLNKSMNGQGRELISPELYCQSAHVQPLARCLTW